MLAGSPLVPRELKTRRGPFRDHFVAFAPQLPRLFIDSFRPHRPEYELDRGQISTLGPLPLV